MKIAIHHRPGSFSDIWIRYCEKNNIPYKIVNCFDTDIIKQIEDCEGLMWHWPQWDSKAILFARQLTYSVEKSGKKVFPNSQTCWLFDDKLGQKYLFEALKIESILTWVFYDLKKTFDWIRHAEFPVVFKLRGGASSENVKLIKSAKTARKITKIAFGKGFKINNKWNKFKDRILLFNRRRNLKNFIHILKGVIRLVIEKENEKNPARERGYVYFQKFIPGNDSDVRLVVVGSKCFGMRRYSRKGDFRASGSGDSTYDNKLIESDAVQLAFKSSEKLNMQSAAFDFIKENDQFKLVEVSYAFVSTSFPGFWDSKLKWHDVKTSPQEVIIEEFINSISNQQIR